MSELTCTFKELRPVETGTSKAGKDYQSQMFKVEYQDNAYTNSAWFKLFGRSVGIADDIAPGEQIKVDFTPTSREWNDKVFTENNAWKIIRISEHAKINNPAPVPALPPAYSPAPSNAEAPHDDLPF